MKKKKEIKYIGRLNNYKKYPRFKGAKNFVYFDESYPSPATVPIRTDFYPTIGFDMVIIPLIIQLLINAFSIKGYYFGIWFDVGLLIGWIIDSLLRLWPLKYYDKIKYGWCLTGIIFMSGTPIHINIYKRIERVSLWIRNIFFVLLGTALLYYFTIGIMYLFSPSFFVVIGMLILICGPVIHGSANYKKVKNTPEDLLLIHHNAATYAVSESVYNEYMLGEKLKKKEMRNTNSNLSCSYSYRD